MMQVNGRRAKKSGDRVGLKYCDKESEGPHGKGGRKAGELGVNTGLRAKVSREGVLKLSSGKKTASLPDKGVQTGQKRPRKDK